MNSRKLTVINLPKDGIGSLLEFILGVLFFCHQEGLTYVHTNLHDIEHNKDMDKKEWMEYWDVYIKKIFLPDIGDSKDCNEEILDITHLSHITEQQNILFRLTTPVTSHLKYILDRSIYVFPSFRKHIVDNYRNKTTPTDFFPGVNIAVHIRRYMESDCDPGKWRELYEVGNYTDTYFQNIIKDLSKLLPTATIHVYSQGDETLYTHYKKIIPNLKLYLTNTAEHDLLHLIHADILVMSKGSYSRIANFYSNGIKLIRESSWPTLTEDSMFVQSSGLLTEQQKSVILNKVSPRGAIN